MTTKISKLAKRIQEKREKTLSSEELEIINNNNLEKERIYRDNFDLKQKLDEATKNEKNERMKVMIEENTTNLNVVIESAEDEMKLKALLQHEDFIKQMELERKDKFKGTHEISTHASQRMVERNITTLDLANNRAVIKGSGKQVATTYLK